MTLVEARDLGKKLTDINIKYWDACSFKDKNALRNQFKVLSRLITSNGFKIKKSKDYDPLTKRLIPLFKIIENTSVSFLEINNNTPKSLNVKGDCTTRCISFCTGVDYMTIRNEQLHNSAYAGITWRSRIVWEQSLVSRGFKVINLNKRMSRKTFIKTFGNVITNGIIATHSSGHIAAIDMSKKKVIDTWDSTGGRIDFIYVHASQYYDVKHALGQAC